MTQLLQPFARRTVNQAALTILFVALCNTPFKLPETESLSCNCEAITTAMHARGQVNV